MTSGSPGPCTHKRAHRAFCRVARRELCSEMHSIFGGRGRTRLGLIRRDIRENVAEPLNELCASPVAYLPKIIHIRIRPVSDGCVHTLWDIKRKLDKLKA